MKLRLPWAIACLILYAALPVLGCSIQNCVFGPGVRFFDGNHQEIFSFLEVQNKVNSVQIFIKFMKKYKEELENGKP